MDLIWLLDEEWGCLQRNLRGKKGTLSSGLLKKKGRIILRTTPDHRLIQTTRKKWNKSETMWYQPYFLRWQ